MLTAHAQRTGCIDQPPVPLILSGWYASNDWQKRARWEETVEWAVKHGCSHIVEEVQDGDHYAVVTRSSSTVMDSYASYRYGRAADPAPVRSREELLAYKVRLETDWHAIAGNLGPSSEVVRFTGKKGRRLVVRVAPGVHAPWGDWIYLSRIPGDRARFTQLRQNINEAIAPHQVDHVSFRIAPLRGVAFRREQ